MLYRFSNTSSKESNFVPLLSCFFARLIDWINSLFDIIFKVSITFFQSSRLKTTDFGLPSGVVMYSILDSSNTLSIIIPPSSLIKIAQKVYERQHELGYPTTLTFAGSGSNI